MTTGIGWVDFIIIVSMAAAAVWVVSRQVILPFIHAVFAIIHGVDLFEAIAPTLIGIGKEFQPNGGSSLKDSLNRIEVQLATNSREVAATRTDLADQALKLETLEKYAHRYRHEQGNDITKLLLADAVLRAKLDQLADHLEPLPDKLDAIADAASAADTAAVEHREAHEEQQGE